jgi:hypothetical protein
MATGPNRKDIGQRAREIRQRLEEIEKQLDGEATDQPATDETNEAGPADPGAFEYSENCPACLRERPHTRKEHEQALARVAQASAPDAPDDEGSMFS